MRKSGSFLAITWLMLQGATLHAQVVNRRLHANRDPVKVELTGFSADEQNTIDRSLAFLAARLAEIEGDVSLPLSRFERCIGKYATKDFLVWDAKKSNLENKYSNAYAIYGDVTQVIEQHFKTALPVGIAAMTGPVTDWGNAMLGYRPAPDDFADLYIELNPAALRKYPNSIPAWAGTVFHEFLHRTGLTHPTGYPGSLIREAEGCIARRFADKATLLGIEIPQLNIIN